MSSFGEKEKKRKKKLYNILLNMHYIYIFLKNFIDN